MTRRLYPLLPVFALTALTLLVFWKLAFTDLILARGDTYYYFYPLWAARDAALRAGELPLWTTQVFMGAPLLADPQLGTLYPPNWLTLRLDPPDAIRVSVLLHVTWAAVGAYALARRALRLDVVPAVITGAIFGFGGVIGAHVEQINQLQGLAWLPWALLIFDRAPAQPLRYTPLLAVVLALQFLSGHTQTVFITGVGLGVYALAAVLFPDNTGARHARARHAVPLPPASGERTDLRQDSFSPLAPGGRGAGGEGEAHSTGIHNPSLSRQRGRIGAGVISLVILIAAVLLTGLLSAAQLIPTLELTGLSNRVDFNPQQAMAFSWNPLLAGRGLLPSYDAQVFGEYVAYIGVSGLALALIGVFAGEDRRRWRWVLLAGIGIGFAFGLYNPLYWTLAGLPGFNLFRVPARWLALFAISAALLTGCGVQTLLERPVRLRRWVMGVIVVIVALIAASTLLADRAALEVDGPAQPGLLTLIAWAGPLLVVLLIAGLRPRLDPRGVMIGLAALVVGELWFASLAMPYNDLAHPEVYHDARLSIRQLQAYQAALPACDAAAASPDCIPGRVLSISNGYFDPGDKGNLQTRYAASGMTDRAIRHALTAAKLKELVAPNFPLIWDVPSMDGAGGGLVPTTYYTQFSSLLLPEGLPRSIDGRLREMLALPACNGACLPAERWLDLTNTRYLLLDKTYDLVRDGIRYDTAFTLAPGDSFTPPTEFVGTELHLLYTGDQPPRLTVNGITLTFTDAGTVGAFRLATAPLDSPQALTRVEISRADPAVRLHALTLVDTRTGDFMQVPLGAWRLALSSDIKLYENLDVMPRAFVVADTRYVPDTWQGTETALTLMRDPGFDPRQTAILAGEALSAPITGARHALPLPVNLVQPAKAVVVPVRYTATEAVFQVDAPDDGTLVITDAAYPGWQATINGEPAPLYRADALFRGVVLPAGASEVRLIYAPDWLPGAFVVSGIAWLLVIGVMVGWGLRARMLRGWQGRPGESPRTRVNPGATLPAAATESVHRL